jgi:hypothetical protein
MEPDGWRLGRRGYAARQSIEHSKKGEAASYFLPDARPYTIMCRREKSAGLPMKLPVSSEANTRIINSLDHAQIGEDLELPIPVPKQFSKAGNVTFSLVLQLAKLPVDKLHRSDHVITP